MIRPFTLATMLLAGIAGVYLYSSKHRVQLLDRQIEATLHQARAARERTAILRAEWTLQNDPMRLKQLADKFLTLKPVAPSQFTTLSELDKRLPPSPDPNAPPAAPMAETTDQEATPPPPTDSALSAPSSTLSAPSKPGEAQAANPPETKPTDTKPAEAKAPEAKPPETKSIETKAPETKPTEPKQVAPHDAEAPRLQASHDSRAKPPAHPLEHRREVARAAPIVTRSALAPAALPPPVATEAAAAPAARETAASVAPSATRPSPIAPHPSMVSALGVGRTALAPPVPLPQAGTTMVRDGN
jgi:hypothetical protein